MNYQLLVLFLILRYTKGYNSFAHLLGPHVTYSSYCSKHTVVVLGSDLKVIPITRRQEITNQKFVEFSILLIINTTVINVHFINTRALPGYY